MCEEADIDILEHAGFHKEGFRSELFLGYAGPEAERALQVFALHHFLHGDGGKDVERYSGIVTFTVSGRAFDDGFVPADAGLLRSSRDIVDIGAERDYGLARSPGRYPCGGNIGIIALNPEALFLQNAGEVLRCFELLETELAEAEYAIDHDLRLLLHGVDLAGQIGLHGGFFLGGNFGLRLSLGLREGAEGAEQRKRYEFLHGCSYRELV